MECHHESNIPTVYQLPNAKSFLPNTKSFVIVTKTNLFQTNTKTYLDTSFELCEPEAILAVSHDLALGGDGVKMAVTGKNFVNIHDTAAYSDIYTGGNLKVKLPMMEDSTASW